jgi:hypothetical protein
MIKEGTGGRIYPWPDRRQLEGLLSTNKFTIRLGGYRCANPRCERVFNPRAEGDLYCSESCDLDANPNLKAHTPMIDHFTHVLSVVKEELAKVSLANGVDKSLVGFVVSALGPTPIQTPGGAAMINGAWLVTVTLRTELIGQPPIPAPVIIPGPMPDDADFRGAVGMAVKACVEARDKLMRGEIPA